MASTINANTSAGLISTGDTSGVLALQTGGTTAVTVDSSQNVGIGTSSPSTKLQVSGGVSTIGGNAIAAYGFTNSDTINNSFYLQNSAGNKAANFQLGTTGILQTWVYGGSSWVNATTIDSSGNFGLGVAPNTSSSSGKTFQIRNTLIEDNTNGYAIWRYNNYYDGGASDKYIATGAASSFQLAGNIFRWYQAASGTAGSAATFTQAMTLDASGNLLVGTTSTSYAHKFTKNISDAYAFTIDNSTTGNPYGLLISYSGKSGLSTANELYMKCQDTTAVRMYIRSDGGIANYQGNNANLSDRREKTDFAPAKSYLDVICAIPVQTYKYIDQSDDELTLGVVAQDVQAVAPELITESNWGTDEEPKMRLSIYQTDLQYALMKCIQEQQTIIQTLTSRIEALENK